MQELTRRSMLKTSALGLGVLAASALTGCTVTTDPSAGASGPATVADPTGAASASASATPTASAPAVAPSAGITYPHRSLIVQEYAKVPAGKFGLEIPGIQLGLPKGAKGTALTFDACGGAHGSAVDQALLDTLRKNKVPATLFVNQRWAKSNSALLTELVTDPLFEIANHGTLHAPLCTAGQKAYGIPGTSSVGEAYDEVMDNQRYLGEYFGILPKFFRSGTAHMDEAGAALCRELGLIPMNFTVNLDAGATFPAATVASQMRLLGAGDVGIGHFNQPGKGTAAGVKQVLAPALDAGVKFIRLSEAW